MADKRLEDEAVKKSIEDFKEAMDHEGLSDSVTLTKEGYRLDPKGRGEEVLRGIRCEVNCNTYKSVDYLYDTGGQAYLVEFSDIWRQHLDILDFVKRINDSNLNKQDKKAIVQKRHAEIRDELKTKLKDSVMIISKAHDVLDGWSECLKIGEYRFRVIIAENKSNSPDLIRFVSLLISQLRTSMRSEFCSDIKVNYIDVWAKSKNYT